MKISVNKIIPQTEKIRVIVSFYDDLAHWHQDCETTVFLDHIPNETLDDIQNRAIQAAKEFLVQCQE